MNKKSLPALLPLCLAMIVSRQTMALGLGDAELDSYLGRPLLARIPVFSAENLDAEQLNVRLLTVVDTASDSALSNLEASKIGIRKEIDASGRGVIYLQSQVPLNEPFLNFILQVRWPTGSLQREYTLLLDIPPALPNLSRSAGLTSVAVSQESPSPAAVVKPMAARPMAKSEPEPIGRDSDSYTTVRGDSLWAIASRIKAVRGGGQMELMTQLFALNPQAFIRGDRNLLKERVSLDINSARLSAATVSPVRSLKIEQADVPASVAPEPGETASDADSSEQNQSAMATTAQIGITESAAPEDSESRLLAVGEEIQAVAGNIEEMTARLGLLEQRLARLQEQYTQMEGGAEALPASPAGSLAETQPTALAISDQGSDAGVTERAAGATAETDAGLGVVLPRDTSRRVSEGRGWFFGLLFVAVAGLLWFLRRREPKSKQAPPVLKGPALQPAAGNEFEEVFTGLSHSWSTGVSGQDAAKAATSQNAPDEAIQKEPESAVAGDAVADGLASVEAANDSDETFVQPIPSAREAEVSDAKTEGLFIDDDLDLSAFEDEELDLEQLIGSSAPCEEKQWASSELRTQAAACVKMDDWTGAQRLFEKALAADEDNAELKMELLDVYAHVGDVASFESLALQMEFGGASNRTLNEIELLRNTLREQENRLGTQATDFRGK